MSAEVKQGGLLLAQARIGDERALQDLLASLPACMMQEALELAQPTMRGQSVMHYDNDLKRAYFLLHGTDGVLCCVTFDAVSSLGQAALLWMEYRDASECDPSRFAAG